MTTFSFFTLTTSDLSLTKQFRVLWSDYGEITRKKQTVRETVDGELDITQGAIYKYRRFTIKIRHTQPDTDYGTLADLRTFFELNDPNPPSGPSNRLTMVDHYGTEWIVMFGEELMPQPLSVVLEGEFAYWIVPVNFILLQEVAAS